MYTERKIRLEDALPLLERCGLTRSNQAPQYTVGIYEEDGEELLATGSLVGSMLQMLAVDPDRQGEDLLAKLVTHLLREAFQQGICQVYLFTRYEKQAFFQGLGFSLVADVPGKAALLEWGQEGIQTYCRRLRAQVPPAEGSTGALVMNCNPFTLGHRYLIEQAANLCDRVVVLAVEEDLSLFPFEVRLSLLRQGTADLPKVTVIPGGRYVISSLTFPSYFTKAQELAEVQAYLDAEVFRRHLVPALGIQYRFLGTEPLSPVTQLYNQVVTRTLEPAGVSVRLIPRLEVEGEPVSASRVRALLGEGRMEAIRPLVPHCTWQYLNSPDCSGIRRRLREGAEL